MGEDAMKLRSDSLDSGESRLPLDFAKCEAPTIGFQLPDGSYKLIDFGSRRPPLGIRFKESNDAFITLGSDPGGHGEALGVGAGWVVRAVLGESVVDKGSSFAYDKLR